MLLALLTCFIAALQAPLLPETPPDAQPSAWDRLQAAEAQVLAAQPSAGGLFSALTQFSAEELRQALAEGVQQTRAAAGLSPREADQAVLGTITRCLDVYPAVAKTNADLMPFIGMVENPDVDPVLRIYITSRLAEGLAPLSPFSEYLASGARANFGDVAARLTHLSYQPAEPPALQRAALEALYALHAGVVQEILNTEPALAARFGRGVDVDPNVIREKGFKLSRRNEARFAQKQADFQSLAPIYARHLAQDSPSPPDLKEAAAGILQKMVASAPLKDRNAVRNMIPKEYLPQQ